MYLPEDFFKIGKWVIRPVPPDQFLSGMKRAQPQTANQVRLSGRLAGDRTEQEKSAWEWGDPPHPTPHLQAVSPPVQGSGTSQADYL